MRRPRLLVVTRHSPLPENDGAGAYLFDLLSYLAAQGVRIEISWVFSEGAFIKRGWWRVPSRVAKVADVRIIGSLAIGRYRFFWWGPLKARLLSATKSILMRFGLWGVLKPVNSLTAAALNLDQTQSAGPVQARAAQWSETLTEIESRFSRSCIKRFRPDAVLANYCWMTPVLRDVAAKKLVLTHDVASHRLNLDFGRRDGGIKPSLAATATGEAQLLANADTLLAISADDASVFEAMVPRSDVVVVPKAAPLRVLPGNAVPGRCLFVGGQNEPNREGLEWFLSDVWPSVKASQPDAVLHVCGAIGEQLSKPLPADTVLRGRVENLESEYAAAAVVIVPLLRGTGVKIKLTEAAGFGKACVTTPVGLQGLPFLRDAVVEATKSDEFAAAVIRVLSDSALRIELQHRISHAVAVNLSPETCYKPVHDTLLGRRRAAVKALPESKALSTL